jgi:hypothetical protein
MLIVIMALNPELAGTIPSTIGTMEKLSLLYLVDNSLSGSIPSALFALEELKELRLSTNLLDGTLPDIPPGSLGLLGTCVIASSCITLRYICSQLVVVALSCVIGRLTEFLDLSDNSLYGTIPSALFACEELKHLRLQNNLLDGTLPDIPSGSLGLLGKCV